MYNKFVSCLLAGNMTTQQTFSPARLLLGLVGVSFICATIALLPKPWAAHWIWQYIFVLVLPTVGYGCVFYWSRIFANLDALQRAVIGGFGGVFLALGFAIAFLDCLVPMVMPRYYWYEQESQSTSLPLQDVRWGFRGDRLLFAVFQTGVMSVSESHTEAKAPIIDPNPKNPNVMTPHYDHWIQLPDGTQKDLPGSRTMFEYDLGGAFISRPVDVTLDEFREWLASRPATYSIEKLEEFVAQEQKHI
jgi:hypothetical protein